MRFHTLACDYDGTLAHHGHVEPRTIETLRGFKRSGRKLVLVTGRRLDDLTGIFPDIKLFDMLVVENGAVLVNPATGTETLLASGPPPGFAEELSHRGVAPLEVGRVIVSTWQPHETTFSLSQ
jgi:HAD superfamily hydrolase (TIGR01484 family)